MFQGEGHYFDIGCRCKNDSECLSPENVIKFSYFFDQKMRSRYQDEEIPMREQLEFENIFKNFTMKHFDAEKLVGEKSPNYFLESKIPWRIREYNPNIKIVMLLCEPSDRAGI